MDEEEDRELREFDDVVGMRVMCRFSGVRRGVGFGV